jgi:PAS domain S-box-containing protein
LSNADEQIQESPCAEEPIRIPGSIQQHGFFLLIDRDFERVLVASENAERYLRLPIKLILGANVETLLAREMLTAIRLQKITCDADPEGLINYLGSFRLHDEVFSIVTHCLGKDHVLEFERQEQAVGPEMMNAVITNFVSKLGRVHDEGELCTALAQQMAELTGFDRILLYSFDSEGAGTVVAEVNNGRLPRYLHLRFPATDIPQQARDLYLLNTVRIIPDADYTPSPLIGTEGVSGKTLDLSRSILRSVSPIHLQYMRNMETLSSMSVSIVSEGRLWGLISAHHAEPKVVPFLVRSACDMLTRMASTQLTAFRTAGRLQQTLHFHAVQRGVLTELAAEQNYLEGLEQQLPALREITNAAGVALLANGHFARHGCLPDEQSLQKIVEWLETMPDFDLFHTGHLSAHLPWTDAIREDASGLIAVRISSVLKRYLLWFRPEVIRTVRWAGEPEKSMDQAGQLHPRSSFAEWKEIVRGRSEPWTAVEIESASDFRSALTAIGLRRAEEAIELGEARFQQLTQALPAKIFTADDEGRITYVNDRWIQQGLHRDGCWFEEPEIAPEDARRCAELWRGVVGRGEQFETELRLHPRHDGPPRWNLVRVIPFQRMGGRRAGWIGTFIDLTESKERELALRMTEKLALTGRMTSVIAHEINNPLEAITNLMYLLRSELRGEGPAGGYIAMVESELERISGITKQTLRWNRETSDLQESFFAGFMVDDVLRLFAGKVRNRQIAMKIEGPRELELKGVIGQVRQVLANLISNAIDASPLGGKVVVKVLEAPNEGGFAVRDNGPGIPEALRTQLFQPFFSTKGDLGNGLGLYISKEIVERHGGRIEVDSNHEKGTTMTVWLPRMDGTGTGHVFRA